MSKKQLFYRRFFINCLVIFIFTMIFFSPRSAFANVLFENNVTGTNIPFYNTDLDLFRNSLRGSDYMIPSERISVYTTTGNEKQIKIKLISGNCPNSFVIFLDDSSYWGLGISATSFTLSNGFCIGNLNSTVPSGLNLFMVGSGGGIKNTNTILDGGGSLGYLFSVNNFPVYPVVNGIGNIGHLSLYFALSDIIGFTPTETCIDGILNQDETDIDVGGVCPSKIDNVIVQNTDDSTCIAYNPGSLICGQLFVSPTNFILDSVSTKITNPNGIGYVDFAIHPVSGTLASPGSLQYQIFGGGYSWGESTTNVVNSTSSEITIPNIYNKGGIIEANKLYYLFFYVQDINHNIYSNATVAYNSSDVLNNSNRAYSNGVSVTNTTFGDLYFIINKAAPTCSDGILNQDETSIDTGGVCGIKSSEKAITSFNFQGITPNVNDVIVEVNHTIGLTVPYGTDVSSLVPTINIATGALINPNNSVSQNFSNPVIYTVTAEDESTKLYTVTVVPSCVIDCFSNVLFLPGVLGSRLYEQEENGSDKELWVSSFDSRHSDLTLNNLGKSINDIYTKNDTERLDVDGDETGIVDDVYSSNIYQSFIDDLNKWKEDDKIIEDYAFIPYDWRLSLDDIITNGIVDSNNSLYYNKTQDFSKSFILKKLEDLQSNSRTGKVTIIAHSNGGLVTKALINKLKETNNPLYDKIDKVIFIAVPQVGTPEAVATLLHGLELGRGFVMSDERSRQLSENMQSAYNLLPSSGYFTTVDPDFAVNKIVTFKDTSLLSHEVSQYGVDISSVAELKNYVLGSDGRTKPEYNDTVSPNNGNSTLYNNADTTHQVLDSWQPSPSTKVIQIAGWGKETIAGLDYYTYLKNIFGDKKISYKIRNVIDGDGTVVVPSALWMSVSNANIERWWVDLKTYNKPFFGTNRDHKDILEIPSLRDFINSKIKDLSFTDTNNIVLNNEPILSSNSLRLHYTLHSPLTLGISDTQGRYTGQDPITKEIKEEIPDVTYKKIGDVQFISIPTGVAYTLKLQGYQQGDFSLDVDEQNGNIITESASFQGIPSSISTVATMDIMPSSGVLNTNLKIDQNGDGIIDLNLVPKLNSVVTIPKYSFSGFLQPINDTAHQVGQSASVFKAGSTVPVKFQLKKLGDGTIVQSDSNPIWISPQKGSSTNNPIDESEYNDPAPSGSIFKWDSVSKQYIYNWSTKGLSAGYWYKISAQLDDGYIYSVTIGLK